MNTAEYLNTLIECKEDMKAALIEQGAPPTGGLSTYADAIKEIKLVDDSVLTPFPVGTKFGWSDFKEFAAGLINPDETDFSNMFSACENLETIPYIDTSRVTNMEGMLSNCEKLTTIPQLDTSNVEWVDYMFDGCYEIKDIPLLDFGNVIECSNLFGFSTSYDIFITKNMGGFKDLGKKEVNLAGTIAGNYFSLNLRGFPHLTISSAINVINNLYDLNLRERYGTGRLRFNENTLALLSDDIIAVATNKGWSVS